MLLEFVGYFSFTNLTLLAIVCFFKKDSVASGTRIFSYWLASLAYTQLIFMLFYTYDIEKFKSVAYTEAIAYNMSMPLFYFYILRLTNQEDFLSHIRWFHLLPMIPGLIYWGVHISLSPVNQLASIRTDYCGPLRVEWLNVLGIAFQIFYIQLSYRAIQHFTNKAKHILSNIDKLEIRWMQLMLTSFLFIAISTLILNVFIQSKSAINLVTILSLDLIFLLIYLKHLIHPLDFMCFKLLSDLTRETGHPAEISSIRYKGFRIKDEEVEELHLRILVHMENAKPFLFSELSLNGLADMLHTTTHRLSYVINTTMGMNYFDFINSYRIKEAISLLETTHEIDSKIIAIAYDSGFNNRTSFHLAFKKFTGYTPKEYREKHVKVLK